MYFNSAEWFLPGNSEVPGPRDLLSLYGYKFGSSVTGVFVSLLTKPISTLFLTTILTQEPCKYADEVCILLPEHQGPYPTHYVQATAIRTTDGVRVVNVLERNNRLINGFINGFIGGNIIIRTVHSRRMARRVRGELFRTDQSSFKLFISDVPLSGLSGFEPFGPIYNLKNVWDVPDKAKLQDLIFLYVALDAQV